MFTLVLSHNMVLTDSNSLNIILFCTNDFLHTFRNIRNYSRFYTKQLSKIFGIFICSGTSTYNCDNTITSFLVWFTNLLILCTKIIVAVHLQLEHSLKVMIFLKLHIVSLIHTRMKFEL
jgi:hypothetical protein